MEGINKKITWGEDTENSGPRNYFRETLIIKALQNYTKKGKILDAGCGNGSLSIRLTKLGYGIDAFDPSRKSISYLKKKIKKENIKNLKPRVASLYQIPFNDKTFDGVVCGEVLEHLDNDSKAIREMYRILKPKGICIVSVPAKMKKWDVVDYISDHKRRYLKEELIDIFEKEGFSIKKVFYWGFPFANLWHSYFYRPVLEKKLKTGYNLSSSKGFFTTLLKSESIHKFFSYFFYFDNLFINTNLGNFIILSAFKK